MSRAAADTSTSGSRGPLKLQAAFVGTVHSLDGSVSAARTASGVSGSCTLVRLVAKDNPAHFAFGDDEVDADTDGVYIPADSPEYFAIEPGQYVSVIGAVVCVMECG